RAVVQIEIPADFLDDSVQAARANQFESRLEISRDANLAFHEFGGRADFERLDLPDLRRMEIECAGSVRPVDAGLVKREFVNVEKHRFSPQIRVKPHYRAGRLHVKKACAGTRNHDTKRIMVDLCQRELGFYNQQAPTPIVAIRD